MDLSDAFRQQLRFKEPVGTRGAHGDPDFTGAALQVANARVEASSRAITSSAGEQVIASHFVMADKGFSLFARVWLPGADTNNDRAARKPVRVDPQVDLDGNLSHWEAYF